MNETERIEQAKTELKKVSDTIGFNNVDDVKADFRKIKLCNRAIAGLKQGWNVEQERINKLLNGQKITLNRMVV